MTSPSPGRIRPDGTVDAAALERELRRAVQGPVRFDAKARGLYATDASNYRHVPLGVVLPLDADDVVAAVAACRRHAVPVTVRGAGTSVAGNATGRGVVLDCSRNLTRVLHVDPRARTAVVEPGVVLDRLNAAVAVHGLRFGPDPSTHSRATIGGMIGNDACGARSVAWGRTSDAVESLDVLLYDGTRMTVRRRTAAELDALCAGSGREAEVYRALRAMADANLAALRTGFPQLPRRVSGYPLDALLPERGFDLPRALVGTEGTCVVVLTATVRLVPVPASAALVVAGFEDDVAAAHAVPAVRAACGDGELLALEGMDRELVDTYLAHRPSSGGAAQTVHERLPPGAGWLFVEVGGSEPASAADAAARVAGALREAPGLSRAVVVGDPAEQRALWRMREEGAGLATRLPDGSEAFPGWEDASVPPERLGAYLRDIRALLGRHGLRGVSFGHFGDGCVHSRIDVDLLSAAGRRRFRAFLEDAADLVVRHGGSLSGEHGDGQARGELLARMYRPEVLALFAAFKAVWDPDGGLNPGVVVDPAPLDADMRVTERAARPVTDVVFGYTADGGDFAKAVRRCVGVGRCRTESGGVMCPSWRATHAEEHSTRGRAHLLLEMLDGGVVTGGWRAPEVREALDLCLSCRGCASDCPVDVDMATYKAEFLHHHYAGRLRPASHYAMGRLPRWVRLAHAVPGAASVVNAAGANRLTARVLRRAGGIAPERAIPRLARRSLRRQVGLGAGDATRPAAGATREPGPRLVLWPDTFTNHFTPDVGLAAVRVLASAGLPARVPDAPLCCGLTWISTGQLDGARRVLRRTLDALDPWLRDAGDGSRTWIVGLEPSCTAALRVDLPELLPGDARARDLAGRVLTFAEALDRFAPEDWGPRANLRALRQTHCHQHAVLGVEADRRVLARAGVEDAPLPAGCCGLAGNFGFERGHYEVSVAVAELGLLPALRSEDPSVPVLADGFSCRTQIEQLAGRPAVHLAQLLDVLVDEGRHDGRHDGRHEGRHEGLDGGREEGLDADAE